MSQTNRIGGGLVDTNSTIKFAFNDQQYSGHPGDTLASALLANGVRLMGRSFKYHRPRGVFSAGSEEPNALMELRRGAHQEPNTRATVTELFDGLQARSQNHKGPLGFDLMGVNDLLSPFLSAGFYYKTFMWPKAFWEKLYEPIIRRAAGLGTLSGLDDPDIYDKGFLHADILIIGAGPAGLSAALLAGLSGARVILADEDFRPGGRLHAETLKVEDMSGSDWVAKTLNTLSQMENVRLMTRTTVYGAFDHGIYGALERKTDHLASSDGMPRQVLWRIYAKRSIVCAGAIERSIAFGNNDRPGVMLAGAVRAYANRWGVTPGKRVSVFTNNDDGWRTASDLVGKGIEVSAVIDSRNIDAPTSISGASVVMGASVVNTFGRTGIHTIELSNGQTIKTDCLAVSGGWSPNVHLTCHQRGRPTWHEPQACFIPGGVLPEGMSVAGAANGALSLNDALSTGNDAAKQALMSLDITPAALNAANGEDESTRVTAIWHIKQSTKRCWIDLQNDVTTKDIVVSHKDGFRAVEHLKRYTTLGMATDQGKTSNVLGLAIMAEHSGKSIQDTGTTIFRPPYTPVPIGALAGRSRGKDFKPTRNTPSHDWAVARGAEFVETGNWMRAQWFALEGETHWRETVDREVTQTRNSVGICDVSTLGKIDVQGKDAGEFLNRVYANTFATLAVGKVRYGIMLREDGILMDDGTTARMGENHFVMTTTTANAVSVFRHMEFCRQCLWPGLDVQLISATEQWAQFAVAGPNSRKLLENVVDADYPIDNESFPFMGCSDVTVFDGTPARLFRISFSGELAFEIAVPTRYGNAMMDALMQAGEAFDAIPYGTEALGVMRIEKGHAAGNELNGQTTAANIGLGRMVSKKKDSIGNTLSEREGLNTENDLALVGFKPTNPAVMLSAGAHFVSKGNDVTMDNDEGWMTSVAYSPSLGHSIGLGYIQRGQDRLGDVVVAADPLRGGTTEVEIVSPHFIDPEGERLRG